MSDNPMYWPGHQRPAWHQQPPPPPPTQPVNTMSHYATHPGNMLGNPMTSSMSAADPSSLSMQSSIPGRHQPHHSTLAQHQSTLAPPVGAQSSLYSSMMPAPPGAPPSSARPTTQLTSNSHLNSPATQGIPSHPGLQQSPHPQSHYPHQYSSLTPSYWNPPSMNSQSSLGPTGASSASAAAAAAAAAAASQGTGPPPPPQPDGTSSYHSTSASPLAMPTESRGSLSTNSSATLQQTTPAFHSPKDIQASSEHMMSYERQRGSMAQQQQQQQQQQHSSAMMSQNVPSSTASNLSPTQSQLSMQGRLQSQSQLDSMRSMSQQPSWSSSYYAQPNQSLYSSVMNPYMPYGGSSANHGSVAQPPTRPAMGPKSSLNGSERTRAAYPPQGSSLYGQPAPPSGNANGGYYGYDSYYNQVASQAPTDPYLSHPSSASSSQHWPSSAPSNQLQSNSSSAPGPLQPQLRQQTGTGGSSMHPQSPSAPSSLPTLSSRPPPPPSQTPDRSPAPQLPTSYPSPNQQGSSSKSTSNSLAQLEQMVMPNSGQNTASAIKSPTHRSSTSSPSTNTQQQQQQQQQLQYSYNSSGQGSYFSTGAGANANQSSYYPQYESSGVEMQKSNWSEPAPGSILNPLGQPAAPPMMDSSGQSSYGQATYDNTGSYGDYTALSVPGNTCGQSRFSTPGDTTEPHSSDKSDPYAIDSQTFDDYDDQSSSSKTKKGRGKKGDEKVKKERKPRTPRAPKTATPVTQPQSPAATASMQALQAKQQPLPQTLDISPPGQQSAMNCYPSPGQQPQIAGPTSDAPPAVDSMLMSNNVPSMMASSTSPVTNTAPSQPNYYPQYESSGMEYQKTNWQESTPSSTMMNSSIAPPPPQTQPPPQAQLSGPPMMESAPGPYVQTNYDGTSSYGQPAYDNTYSGEYTNLSAPGNSCAQPQYTTPGETAELQPTEKSDHHVLEEQNFEVAEEPEDQSSNSKSKKGKAKKGEEKAKRERKPRASRAKSSTPSQAQTQSPSPTTQLQIKTQSKPQTPDVASPATQSATLNSYTSPTQHANTLKSTDPSMTPSELQNARPASKSPLPGTNLNQAAYHPSYEPGVDASSKTDWSDPTSAPNLLAPPPSSTIENREGYGQAAFNASVPYSEYAAVAVPGDNREAMHTVDKESASVESLPKEDGGEQVAAPKPKKPRVRKRDDKAKKERKPRSAKAPPPQQEPIPEQPSLSPIPVEEIAEPQASQSTSESTPADAKPKRIRIRDSSSKGKKKLPKFALKFAKTKKRKRLGSSDNDQSDLDKTPPPSPDEVESGVQKRRSARNTKKLKYNDDIPLGFSDSDDESQILPRTKKTSSAANATDGDSTAAGDSVIADEPTVFAAPVEDTMVVEKIMASRQGQRELEPEPGEELPPGGTHIEVEEFYIKYKNLSYLHCDWRTLEELEKGDRRVAQKIKRYKQKKDSSNMFSFMDEEPFDLQYCEVDRILAVNEVEEMVPDSDDEDEKDPKKQENDLEKVEDSLEKEANEIKIEENDLKKEEQVQGEPKDQPDKDIVEADANDDKSQQPPVNEGQASESEPAKSEEVVPMEEDPEQQQLDKVKVEEETTESEQKTIGVLPESQKAEVCPADVENVAPNPPDAIEAKSTEPAEKEKKMKKKISRHYLVKWRGLSYEESTWELEDDLDPEKIKQFERFKDPPPKSKWKAVKRPKPEDWVRKEASPIYKNNNTLREYQLEGINWLSFCWHQNRNCILADEMGLGKTIQSIAFVNEIYQYGINGPFLIIVPLSTVGNWAREFETWTDLNVITYHGSSTSREMLKEYEMFYRNEQGNRITSYYKFQVMITTFEIILSDCLDLREIPWKCCIIDEAHRLKNRNCKLLEGLRLLNMEHRVLLTGTPLQNNVEELFSLLNFLEPSQFSSTEQFLLEFGDLKTEAQVDKLKLILKPMMLRRLKEDVEKTLAPKEETIVEVELTNIQKKYYRAILEKNFSFLTKGSSNNNMPNLMNTMMELRKCCIHPYLINGAEEQIMYEARQAKLAGGEPMSSFQAMVNSSGKLVLIDKLLPRLRADGHRVLIFSQMVRCLDILEDYVTHKHYPFERIDGRVRGSDRQQAIDRFSKPGSDRFVFLLCTRAGGLGINLTAADTVIIFDSDWNPQNDLQAQARCHRIGQSKAVKIYRLICRNTYEREMFDKASLKLGLDKAVLQSMNTQKGGSGGLDGQLTKKEIEELLRKGAYGALMDDDNAGDKFCEEDIDQILQRRTQVITIDNSEAKGSTFSKATFSSSNNREDIELDDPNFWEKWAKKANIDSDEMRSKDELIQLEPRRRTQTKRYGADGNLIDMSDLESSEEDEETISMRTRGSRGRQPKLTPSSASKRSKRNRLLEFDDEEFFNGLDTGYWSKSDCLKVEKGLLTYGWGRWEEIIASNVYKKELTVEEVENICRVILLYCLNNYKGDEKIKSFAWELITPLEEINKSQSESETSLSTRGRKQKSAPLLSKKTVAEEIADAQWPRDAKHNPLIALPDDQYRRHLQRNSNRLLIRVKFLHYLKNDILKDYTDKILSDCNVSEVDLPPVPVDGDLPAAWWDDESDKSLLVGIFKHGYDKFNLIRQDPNLYFLSKCGPPNKEDLLAETTRAERNEDLEDENSLKLVRSLGKESLELKDLDAGDLLNKLVDNVVRDLSEDSIMEIDSSEVFDENKNSILKCSESQNRLDDACENGVVESSQTTKMDVTDDESLTNEASTDATLAKVACVATESEVADAGEFLPFPLPNDLNQRFRRLITAYQRNSKKLEIKLAQKVRDDLKKERTSKFEAAKNEKEERKRFLAQKWSRREEADFFRAISSFGVEYDANLKRHDWNKFRSIGKLDKKLDETLEEYYKAFVIMCKKVTSRPLTADEEKCPINVESVTEERAVRCLTRIDFLNKIREQIIVHPELDERLKMCMPQSDLPDWWEHGKHDKDLLLAAAKHGLTRLDYNLAHDPTLSFEELIRQRAEHLFSQPPAPILIPIEQLQELLEKNGIEYLKDLDLQDDSEDVKAVLNSIIESIESTEESIGDTGYKSFVELVDGPHSKVGDDSIDKSILATASTKVSPKTTRSSTNLANLNARPALNILSRRGANTVVKSVDSTGAFTGVRLASSGHDTRFDDRRIVEVTPIMPDTVPSDPIKSFEAGEISLSIQSESALLKLDDRAPIVLTGASNPITVKIRWPKDRAIQTRLENLVYLVEKNEWPSPPKPSVPTITLPNHLASTPVSSGLTVSTSSPAKNDKSELSLGSPKSDISNISSLTSKQDLKERANELSASRGRRGRGRKPRHPEADLLQQELESPKEDRQAAKLRNLLSQGPSSSTRGCMSASSSGEKLTAKFGGNKQGAGLSSLLASFKQKRAEIGGSSRGRDNKNMLDLNNPNTASLLPQILANMKPEFRDLLANQDAATMLLNSLSGLTGTSGIGTSLRSSGSNSQVSLDNLLNVPSRGSKGPPPAHQRADGNPPSAHGNSSTRELRRNSQSTRETSSPSINLRSTRGKGSHSNVDTGSHQKQAELAHNKLPSSKKRGRPSSSASESPPGLVGADVLDLSSLPTGGKSLSSRFESRSRRHRDQCDDLLTTASMKCSSSGTSTKASLRAGSKQQVTTSQEPEQQQSERGVRTTRASKRIGSRIDALALNLQAKRLNQGDSPSADVSPSLPKDEAQEVPVAAHGSGKPSSEHKAHSSKAPPAAHSGSHKSSSSNSSMEQRRDKTNQIPPTSLPSQTTSSSASSRQDPLAQFMANPSALLGGLNPAALGGAGDLMGQLLRKSGTNDIVKNLLNEFMKNPSLASLDPNVLATLTASLPMGAQSLPGFSLPTQTPPASLPSTPSKSTPSSLLNDFKSPLGNSSLMKRSRQESSPARQSGASTSTTMSSESRRSSSSLPNKHERRSSSSSSSSSDRRSGYPERSEKHGKHEKRSSGNIAPETSSDNSSSRRSSSSLLAQQTPTSQQTSQVQSSSSPSVSQPSLPTTSSLNLASQFGGLNSLGSSLNLLNFPGMNELMKQMSSGFPGLAGTLPRVSGAPVVSNSTPISNAGIQSSSDKGGSRRSRQSTGTTSTTQTTSTMSNQQQAANAALASSIMNLANQPSSATNPYGNYANPLANPFLPFGLANLGMNNPLGMGLFPNLYMPPGFPTPDQQQQSTLPPNQTGGSSDGSKDKKTRYPRK